MKNKYNLLATIAITICVGLSSCIKDDIPYPHIQANFIEIEAYGQTQGAQIDTVNRTVKLYFPEQVDIENVEIADYKLTEGAELRGADFTKPIDLSKPLVVNVYKYYDWEWTLTGVQDIVRCFEVDGQVGASTIDVAARRVIAYIGKTADLARVRVDRIKLGADGCTMTPDLAGQIVDFTQPVKVTVTDHGRSADWTIYIDQTEAVVTTVRVDAWTGVAWVYGEGKAGSEFDIEYRLAGDQQWTRLDRKDVAVSGGSFTGRINRLAPMTTYEARAVAGNDYGSTLTFTTGMNVQPPNMDFDQWWLSGKIWCPWAEDGEPYWGTGNKGATTLGDSNSVPTTDTSTGTGWAAMLQTKFVGIGIVGKLAAGNIFTGVYVRTDGTNGVLSFGRPFTERPTRLRGFFKYKTAPISSYKGFEQMKGQPDTCIVWCALIDSDEPYEIRTKPSERHLFDRNGPHVVAYGQMTCGENVDQYVPFEFDLEYTATNRQPKYLIICSSASKYGDYFVGGNGAVLCLDNFELLYDY